MSGGTSYPNLTDIERTCEIADELFGTEEDNTQARPNIENSLKLISIEKNNFICQKDGDEMIAWSVVLPTSTESRKDFLGGKINERELFRVSIDRPIFEALYLTAVIVLPKYRNKGIGSALMARQIGYFKEKYGIKDFYALILTKEGKKLIEKIGRDLNIKIPTVTRV